MTIECNNLHKSYFLWCYWVYLQSIMAMNSTGPIFLCRSACHQCTDAHEKNAAKNRNRFRGVSLLLVCVALGVLLFVGYPVMMPHIAIVSFTIHQRLCPTLDPLSFSKLCLFLFIKLPLANFFLKFNLKIQLSVNARCVFVAAQRLVAVHLPRKITKDKLQISIM